MYARYPSFVILSDGNGEENFIGGEMQRLINNETGFPGSGFFPFFYALGNATHAPWVNYSPSECQVIRNGAWTQNDMYNGSVRPHPVLSPNGLWLKGTSAGSSVVLTFSFGRAVDVYWIRDPAGGSFSISVDGSVKTTVDTKGSLGTSKTTVSNLASGSHSVAISITNPPVTLIGADVLPDPSGSNARTCSHNWGNNFASLADYIRIDSVVFATGLQALNPDIVLIYLGIVDAGFAPVSSADQFKANLIRLVNRVKAAVSTAKCFIVSEHQAVAAYLPAAYPQAASQTGSEYFDGYTWCHTNYPGQTSNYHIGPVGGPLLGAELWRQIKIRYGQIGTIEPSSP